MKRGVLDNPSVIAQLDPSGMLGAVEKSPELLLDPLSSSSQMKKPSRHEFEEIVFGGMGGSAIAADVVIDWLANRLKIPAIVVRDDRLPSFADEDTLVIALSYSGETTETVRLYQAAKSRECPTVGIGTGGRLKDLCEHYKSHFLNVRPSVSPRAALYQMVAACSIVLQETNLTRNLRPEVHMAASEISAVRSLFASTKKFSVNKAKQYAYSMKGKLPVVYALQRMSSVARRFKNQLNENSKIQSKYDLLPESGHNDIEAWQESANLIPVFIRDHNESSFERKTIDAFEHTITKASGNTSLEVRLRSSSSLGRLLCPILFLDYVSIYLAFLRGVDPTPTVLIKEFRKRLI